MSLHQRETIKVPLLFCAWEHGHMAMVELLYLFRIGFPIGPTKIGSRITLTPPPEKVMLARTWRNSRTSSIWKPHQTAPFPSGGKC
jgi:hypothetical protein